ncbi:MAG: hypothetical protein M3545_06295 [Acidobacteriota bacterium]|nr:hypothetical protein [Acidobacteriota bacterium]
MRNRSIFISGALAVMLSLTAGSARGRDNSEPFPITVTAVPQLVVIWVKGGQPGRAAGPVPTIADRVVVLQREFVVPSRK